MITREFYFNVPLWAIVMMYVLTAITIIIYGRVIYKIISQWIKSKKDQVIDKSQVVRKFVLYVLAQKSVFKDRSAGIIHMLIFVGFFGLFVVTLMVMLETDTPLHYLFGNSYIVMSFMADLMGIALLLGLILALGRRISKKPKYLSNDVIDIVLLVILLGIVISGFLIEGYRIALSGQWENWSPIGSVISLLFAQSSAQTMIDVHRVLWLVHLVLAFGLFFLIPFTKLSHVLAAPFNILTSDFPGKIKALPALNNIEQREYLGTGSVQDLTGKDLVEIYACSSCGRCEENCPAVLTGKVLSPKNLVQTVRCAQNHSTDLDLKSLDIWNCTTCGYCTVTCPVSINHQGIIWGLRTYETTRGTLPSIAAIALENIEYMGDPWGITPKLRSETREKLYEGKKSVSVSPSYVFWPGCSINNDLRSHEIATSFVRLLTKAGIDFTVIDGSLGCCGDPARRLGEEGLFQKIIEDNRLLLEKYSESTIVTQCPHCYHVLKNEYQQRGVELEVRHHSEVILELLEQGRLTIPPHDKKRVIYHDPCYLGRYNNLYEPARTLMRSFSDFDCIETTRNRENALCCGGGGGQMWLEAQAGERVNYLRLKEIQQFAPDLIITACPYCNLMMENSISFKGLSHVETKDIVEVFG